MRLGAAAAASIALSFGGQAAAATYNGKDNVALGRALAAQLTLYEDATVRGDIDWLLKSFYSRDVSFINLKDPPVIGYEATSAVVRQVFNQTRPVGFLRADIIKIVPLSPDSALMILDQHLHFDSVSKSVFTWRRENGVWKVICDTYFPSVPKAAGATPGGTAAPTAPAHP